MSGEDKRRKLQHLKDDRRFDLKQIQLRWSSAASPPTACTQSRKIKDKWKLSGVLFAFRLHQQACEGGNDIACSRTTEDLLSQKNCHLIPAQCTLTSSFKLLMFFCLFVLLLFLLHKCCCSTFCAGVSGSPLPLSKTHTSDSTSHAAAGLKESDGRKHGRVQLCAHSETRGTVASGGCMF